MGWVSGQGTPVFWFNKNCASRGPWSRRRHGTRGPARSRVRPWERRSVHKLVEMASRHRFWSFVYTVATREGHARGRGDERVYTDRPKWPLGAVLGHLCTLLRLARVTREAVGTQECTQIGGNGLSELFWVICVHCCDSRGSRASGAAARLASLPRQQPTQTPEEPPMETGQVPETHRRKVRSLSARQAPLVRREMRQAH